MAPLGPNAICFADSQVGFAVGYSGQIMKTSNGGGLEAPEPKTNQTDIFCRNFPNPASGNTTIEYMISGKDLVKLLLYDIWGNKISTLINVVQMPGTYSINYDAGQLTPGIYILKLLAGNQAQTQKLIVVH